MSRVLVVDADATSRRAIQVHLSQEGCDVDAAGDDETAGAQLAQHAYDVVFCAVELVDSVAGELPDDRVTVLIALAERGDRDAGVGAVSGAAFDCMFKPVTAEEVAVGLRRAAKFRALERATLPVPAPRELADGVVELGGMIAASEPMIAVFRTIEKVASHKANVLIMGESGTGKELVARAIHQLGGRKAGPFVAVNCGAIPGSLLESELFGHRRGAFTDAVRDKTGLFEEASSGTLFLDEVGELPLDLQVKLLRAIQEEEIRRVGDSTPIKIDVRIVAATLRDLAEAVKAGLFREDLFYRLNVLPLELPPLRDRREDIPALVHHFVRRCSEKHVGVAAGGVSDEAMALLTAYDWPGNIRELENTIERAIVLCEGPTIGIGELEGKLHGATNPAPGTLVGGDELSIKKTTRRIEEELIRRALEKTGGNRTNASKLLEISHRALLYKIKEYGL